MKYNIMKTQTIKTKKKSKNKKEVKFTPINKLVYNRTLKHPIIQYALNELDIAGYDKTDITRKSKENILNLLSLLIYQDNYNIHHELECVCKLFNRKPITNITFKNDEWILSGNNRVYYNKRANNIIMKVKHTLNDSIHSEQIYDINAFKIRVNKVYLYDLPDPIEIEPIIENSQDNIFLYDNDKSVGVYFNTCYIWLSDIFNQNFKIKDPVILDCVKVEVSPNKFLYFCDKLSIGFLELSCRYNIGYKVAESINNIKLQDITEEQYNNIWKKNNE